VLFGRDAEVSQLMALLERASDQQSGSLLIVGEPGVGKTALLDECRRQAAGMTVLTARGVESESELPFAALHQVLRPALPLLELLPARQAEALAGALGIGEPIGVDRFLISIATLTLLADFAERQPVLCIVDDAQWLDTASAEALLFVAHRIGADRIAMLFAAREGQFAHLGAADLPTLRLEGISADASAALLTYRDAAVVPAVRAALVDQAKGNPLGLIELSRGLTDPQRSGAEPLPAALPLAPDVERLFGDRIRALPADTRELLALIAAETSGHLPAVVAAARALGIDMAALHPAERAGLVSVRDASVEIRHPLVRSAIYQGLSYVQRRAAHAALARAMDTELTRDERAWHLAAATVGADEAVARELDAVADRAQRRSGYAAAAAALERAAAFSETGESRGRRLVQAARSAWHAGHPDTATALAEQAAPLVSTPELRADLQHVRGQILLRCGGLVDAAETLMGAAAGIAAIDTRKALSMLLEAREAAGWAGDTPHTVECDRRAAELPRSDDPDAQFLADLLVGIGTVYEGNTLAGTPLVRDVITRAYAIDEPGWVLWAATGARAIGDEESEAALMRRALSLARSSGAVDKLTYVLLGYVLMSLLSARPAAMAEAAEGAGLARTAGLPNAASKHLAMLAWFSAVRGDEINCRSYAIEAIELARVGGGGFANSIAQWGLGLLELSQRASQKAADLLADVHAARPGEGHPYFALLATPDLVEAAVLAGNSDLAREAAGEFDSFATPDAPEWARALALRCRALTAADDDERTAAFGEALRLHEAGDRLFDRARTELLTGEHLRRLRQRANAREHLRDALTGFERMGAALWAERARAELRATGETARKRDPSTLTQLTPQEMQIARFVAGGLSNKDVATQLFLSPRTVEYHLAKVFTKLGISSRADLIRQAAILEPAG
jgi:DNA-binding CsgD family transcriptional regulator